MPFRVLALIGACIVMILGASESSAQDNPVVVMETSLGDITIELFQAQAPISVENFLEYANDGHYAGTVFHRVIQQFMIQGGGMTADLSPKATRSPIKNEATNGVSNDVSIIDVEKLKVKKSVKVGRFPWGVVVTP